MRGVQLHIRGDVSSDKAIPWICHRALLLNLNGWVERKNDDLIVVAVEGPEPLVDAMEVACSLGPSDILVQRIDRRDYDFQARPNGFSVA
ncbi:MAG: acylphosphatase [Arenibacterium sp.]